MIDQKSYSPKKKQAPPPPPFRQTPTKEKVNDVENDRNESSEENFSMKEMIKLRNGVSKQAVLKARQRNGQKRHNNNNMNNDKSKHQLFNLGTNNRHSDTNDDDEEKIREKAHDLKTSHELSSSPDLHSSREEDNENVTEPNSVSVSSAKQMFMNRSTTVEKLDEKTRPGRLSKQMFQEPSSSSSAQTTSTPPKPQGTPGKISKSFFEQQQQNSDMKKTKQPNSRPSPQKKVGKWSTVQTVVNNNLRSSGDNDLIIIEGNDSNNKVSQNGKDEEPTPSSSHNHHQSPLHSNRSRSSSQGSSRLGSYTLDLGESMNENEVLSNGSTDSVVDGLKHSPGHHHVVSAKKAEREIPKENSPVHHHVAPAKNVEEMPKENTVSSFRDMFQKKNNGEEDEKKKSHNVNVYDHPIKVSSARDLFQNPSSSASANSFKNPPPRLSSVVDELFFHKMNSTATTSASSTSSTNSQPSSQPPSARLQSPGLFFEPNKEERGGTEEDVPAGEENTTPTTEKPIDSPVTSDISKDKNGGDIELKRPRTPQDIWVASEEEFEKKVVENEMNNNTTNDDNVGGSNTNLSNGPGDEERFDDVTSRTHVLLMKQAQGTGDEMPAPIQMAQILGDKDQVILFSSNCILFLLLIEIKNEKTD